MMALSHLAQESTCNTEWNWSTTTLHDLDWKCTLDMAHRSQRLNVFFFSSTILPMPGADKHCGQHHSTCTLSHAPRTLQMHSNWRNPPRSASILPHDCHKFVVPHKLPHWMPRHCRSVPSKASQYQWHSNAAYSKVCWICPRQLSPKHNSHPPQILDNYTSPCVHFPQTLHQQGNLSTHCTSCHQQQLRADTGTKRMRQHCIWQPRLPCCQWIWQYHTHVLLPRFSHQLKSPWWQCTA